MSLNYYVYLKRAAVFSTPDFEEYCAKLGLQIKVHPDLDFGKDSGFWPMRLVDGRFGGSGDFLSGFELYSMDCPKVSPVRKVVNLLKKPVEETEFERAVRGSEVVLALRCGSDAFAVLLAYVFGAYLVKYMGGVFVDHQTGAYYSPIRPMEDAIQQIVTQLQEDSSTGVLQAHDFTEWL